MNALSSISVPVINPMPFSLAFAGLPEFCQRIADERREEIEKRDEIKRRSLATMKANVTTAKIDRAHVCALQWNAIIDQIAIEQRSTGWLGNRLDINRTTVLKMLEDMERAGMAQRLGVDSKTKWGVK